MKEQYFNTAIIRMSIRHCLSDLAHDKKIRDLQLLYSNYGRSMIKE